MPIGSKKPLTHVRVVDTALALIDRKGLEAFSIRRLGAALGCEAMSIYHWFPSKGELLDAIASRLLAEVELSADGDWRTRLRRLIDSYQSVARRHPEAYPLLALRRLNSIEAFRFLEFIFGCLAEAGFDARMRAHIFRLLGQWGTGAGLSELATRSKVPHSTPRVTAEQMDMARFPLTTASTPFLMEEQFEPIFAWCADTLLAAIDALPRKDR